VTGSVHLYRMKYGYWAAARKGFDHSLVRFHLRRSEPSYGRTPFSIAFLARPKRAIPIKPFASGRAPKGMRIPHFRVSSRLYLVQTSGNLWA
jgi:hypothetical protein